MHWTICIRKSKCLHGQWVQPQLAVISVANTFFNHEPREQVTCYDIGSNPGSVLTWKQFGQIDLVLVSHDWLDALTQLFSCMEPVLASHHFLVLAKLGIQAPKLGRQQRRTVLQHTALHQTEYQNRFAALFQGEMEERFLDSGIWSSHMTKAFKMLLEHACRVFP